MILLSVLIIGYVEWPRISGYLGFSNGAPVPLAHANAGTAPDDRLMRDLQKKLAAEKRKQAADQAKALAKLKAAAETNAAPVAPPLAQPTMANHYPARALPVDPNVLTTERIAAYQVAFERMHFSCGFIDGDQGMRTQRMLRSRFNRAADCRKADFWITRRATRSASPGEPFSPGLHRHRRRCRRDHAQAAHLAREEPGRAARL